MSTTKCVLPLVPQCTVNEVGGLKSPGLIGVTTVVAKNCPVPNQLMFELPVQVLSAGKTERNPKLLTVWCSPRLNITEDAVEGTKLPIVASRSRSSRFTIGWWLPLVSEL